MADSAKLGSRVQYQRWAGRVYGVQRDGGLLIEWEDWPGLFFHGPYRPDEVSVLRP